MSLSLCLHAFGCPVYVSVFTYMHARVCISLSLYMSYPMRERILTQNGR